MSKVGRAAGGLTASVTGVLLTSIVVRGGLNLFSLLTVVLGSSAAFILLVGPLSRRRLYTGSAVLLATSMSAFSSVVAFFYLPALGLALAALARGVVEQRR